MTTRTRVYVIRDRASGERYLVRAASPAAAIKHVADSMFRASVASQDELIELLGEGVPVETAGEEPVPVEGAQQQMAEIATEVRALDAPVPERAEPVVVSSADWPYPKGADERRSAA